jgi:vacuolar-type H+-ATPase subunit E/Vma4
MGIESITNKIIEDAEHKIFEIELATQKECEDIKIKADKAIAALHGEIEAKADDLGKQQEAQMLCAARLEANKQIQSRKRSIIDDCFAKALQALRSLSKEEYESATKAMISKIDVNSDSIIEQIGNNEGFIVKQGKIKLNYSFAKISEAIRPQVEIEISKILWE